MSGERVMRTFRAPWTDEPFELVESYDEMTAKAVPPDTSFVASGEIVRGQTDAYPAKSQRAQVVTVLVVPEKQLDNFDITIRDSTGHELARSNSSRYIDWVQIQAPRGGRMTIEVSLAASGHVLSKTYRLYVVGSGSRFLETEIRGAHQASL